MAKGAEDRKTIGIQAKLAQQGVDKEKIKGWIENIEEDNDKWLYKRVIFIYHTSRSKYGNETAMKKYWDFDKGCEPL